jgi:preprotein translocase subunit SecB
MKPTPLRLKLAYPQKLELAIDVDASPEAEYEVSSQLDIARNTSDPREWRVCLEVKFGGKAAAPTPHRGRVQYVGFFGVDESVPEERMARVIAITAPSIVYSSIRELLALLTGRGPMPCLLLPVVTFIDHDPQAQALAEKGASEETAPGRAAVPKPAQARKKRSG